MDTFVEGELNLKRGDWGNLEDKIIIYTKYDPKDMPPDEETPIGKVFAKYFTSAKEAPLLKREFEKMSIPLDNLASSAVLGDEIKSPSFYISVSLNPISEEQIDNSDCNILFADSYNGVFRCEKNLKNAIFRYISMLDWQKKEKQKNKFSSFYEMNDQDFKNFVFEHIVDQMLCNKEVPYQYEFYANQLKTLAKGSVFETELSGLFKMIKEFDIKDSKDSRLEALRMQVDILNKLRKEEYEKINPIKDKIKPFLNI